LVVPEILAPLFFGVAPIVKTDANQIGRSYGRDSPLHFGCLSRRFQRTKKITAEFKYLPSDCSLPYRNAPDGSSYRMISMFSLAEELFNYSVRPSTRLIFFRALIFLPAQAPEF